MMWDSNTVTVKGETFMLTERGKVFFRTVTFIKDALILMGTISFVWFTIAVLAVFE